MPSGSEGGLGTALVGEKIMVNTRQVAVSKLLGEGGFSYVYLVKEISDTAAGGSLNSTTHAGSGDAGDKNGKGGVLPSRSESSDGTGKQQMVLKVTSIISRQQRDIAEKEAKLLSRLSHPSIIKMYDTCYRTAPASGKKGKDNGDKKDRPQHLILMELCEGGHSLEVCNNLLSQGKRFDLSTLIIAFGQICNAVSYLHAQRPPIVHRDLKPANFLVKGGAYKLCDFGSAVFGHVELKTPQARSEAEEVIQKTTTQMFRAPEMVDLFSAKKLTQATDVWALGACLYSMAFLQNCFEEGSNLAILSRKYKIPDDNPYGEGLVELIDRMLTMDPKLRSDMTEVILCLSAVYSGRELPPRKHKAKKEKDKPTDPTTPKSKKKPGFRTDGQGQSQEDAGKTPKEGKRLDPTSVAARRKKSASVNSDLASFNSKFEEMSTTDGGSKVDADSAFAASAESFAAAFGGGAKSNGDAVFKAFADSGEAFGGDGGEGWGGDGAADAFASFSPDGNEEGGGGGRGKAPGRTRSSSHRRPRRKEQVSANDEAAMAAMAKAVKDGEVTEEGGVQKIAVRRGRRGLRRQNSVGDGLRKRSVSRGKVGKNRPETEDSDEEDSEESDE